MHRVIDRPLLIGCKGRTELQGVGIGLEKSGSLCADRPARTPVEMLDDADFSGCRFVVAQGNRKAFVHGIFLIINGEAGLLAVPGQVEDIAGINSDGFVFRRMVDVAFPDKLKLLIGITPVEAHSALGKWHTEAICGRVNKLAHCEDFGVELRPVLRLITDRIVAPVTVGGVDLSAVVDVDNFGRNTDGTGELYLLNFAVAQGSEICQEPVLSARRELPGSRSFCPRKATAASCRKGRAGRPFRLEMVGDVADRDMVDA